jgi:hypothetical protein
MAIVLAIEPDRRQGAHLTAILRQVGAELVIADTTEGALDAIGNRVPDLVLVPALLSPQDDAALAAALRVIAAAAHVRTLTIPVLASGVKRTPVAGMLSKWRKNKAASPEPDGCDPSVFGEQIATYLKEAAAERLQIEEDGLLHAEQAPAAPAFAIEAITHDHIDEPIAFDAASFGVVEPVLRDEFPPLIADRDSQPARFVEPAFFVEPTFFAESTVPAPIESQPFEAPIEEAPVQQNAARRIDLTEELEELAADMRSGLFDGEPAEPVATTAAAPLAEPLFVEQMFVESLFSQQASTDLDDAQPLAVETTVTARADGQRWVPMYLTPGRMWPALEGMPAEAAVVRTDQPDWIELVASLRQDLERRRIDPTSVTVVGGRPSDDVTKTPRPAKRPRALPRKARPVQDEWGFFDPERCGFSTLLAKLEEITEEEVRT